MLRQIELLLRLQLCNAFGLNEARYGRKGKQRGTRIALMVVMALVVLVLCGYVAGLSYLLCSIGAGESIPMLLAFAAGVVTLMLTLFRAGPVIFDLTSYEQLIALPLRPTAIVASRILRMYTGDAALSLAVFLPGTIVAVVMLHPGALYAVMMLLGALLLPLIPMAIATLLGAVIYGISARMRRRSLAVIALTLLMVLALLAGSGLLAFMDEMDGVRILHLISDLIGRVGRFYPPAQWFGRCVAGRSISGFLALLIGSLAFFVLVNVGIGVYFHAICTVLSAHASRRNYHMAAQRRRSRFAALYVRELQRYAASPVYVINTIIGGLMAVLLGVGALIAVKRVPMLRTMLTGMGVMPLIPFVTAFMFVISPSTSCTISLEGKQWWQIKSLPVEGSTVLRAKFVLYLTIALPCWAVMAALLIAALGATGLDAAWMLLVPLAYLLFSGALGLRLNLAMPSFNWESETQPVKQSRPVGFTMLAGFAAVAVPAAAQYLLPSAGKWIPGITALLAAADALLLYRSCCRVDLRELN